MLQVRPCPHTVKTITLSLSSTVWCDRLINSAYCCAKNHLFFLTAHKMCPCWLRSTCPFGKMLIGLFKKKKNTVKLSLTTILISVCSVRTCPLYLTLLSSRPCMKWRGLCFLKTLYHSTWSLCGMFFGPFFCHLLMSAVTVNFVPSTVSWNSRVSSQSHNEAQSCSFISEVGDIRVIFFKFVFMQHIAASTVFIFLLDLSSMVLIWRHCNKYMCVYL